MWYMGREYDFDTGEGDEKAMLLGVFSTLENAQAWQEEAKSLSGFADAPDKFVIDQYTVDRREWTTGFVDGDWVDSAGPSTAEQD